MLAFNALNFERVHTIRFNPSQRTIMMIAKVDGKDEALNFSRSELEDVERGAFDFRSAPLLLALLKAFGFSFNPAGKSGGFEVYRRAREDERADPQLDFAKVHAIHFDAVLNTVTFLTNVNGRDVPLYLSRSGFGSTGMVHFDPVGTAVLIKIIRAFGFTFGVKSKQSENPQVYVRRGREARTDAVPVRPDEADTEKTAGDASKEITAERAVPKALIDKSMRTDKTHIDPVHDELTAKVKTEP